MEDVAKELGISKKTLYQHVKDKEDLVGKFVENEIELRQKDICKCFRIGFNAIEELFEISLFMNRLIKEQNPATEHDLKKYYPGHHQKIVKVRREGIYNYILLNLRKGKKEGLYRQEMNEEVIAKLYLSRSEIIEANNIFTLEEITSLEIFVELLKYHIRGIATPNGIIELEKKIEKINMR
jgi:AcrR family transcriptional regulator